MTLRAAKYLAGLVVVLVVAGGLYFYLRGDPLKEELNKRWPPVSADQQRQKAIDAAASALKLLPRPNIAAGIDIKTIEQLAFEKLKPRGISRLTLTADRQLLRLVADFDRTFSADDLPTASEHRELVGRLSPQISGQVDFLVGAAATMIAEPNSSLQVRLLPAINRIHIDNIVVANSVDLGIAADALSFLINRYADNVGSAINQSALLDVTLPATLQGSFDPSGPIKLTIPDSPDVKFSLSSKPIKSPFGLASLAVLIDGNQVSVMTQLVPVTGTPRDSGLTSSTFEAVKAGFLKQLQDGLGISAFPTGMWVGVSKSLLAASLNSAFDQAAPCVTAEGPIPKQTFSEKIEIPDETIIDCTPTDDCTPTMDCTPTDDCTPTEDCAPRTDCSQTEDCSQNRNCRKKVLGVSVNDPVCEAEKKTAKAKCEAGKAARKAACEATKSTEKGACETRKSARKLDCEAAKTKKKTECEADKSASKLACETAKTTKKFACETAKEGLKRLSRTGNLANIDGSISGVGNLKVCFENVQFSERMDKLSLNLRANGSARLDAYFKFVPLDIVGHLACPAEWTADKTITTQVTDQTIPVNLSLLAKLQGNKQLYHGILDELSLKLHFEPSPLSLILQNINFYVACGPAAGLINGVTLNLAPFIPELLKDYTHKQESIAFSFTPDLPTQSVMGHAIKPKLSDMPLAIMLEGAL